MPDELSEEYENKHLKNIKKVEKQIKKLYESAMQEIALAFSSITYNGNTFYLRDYPTLNNRIKRQIRKLHASVYTAIVNSIEDSWNLANKKNNVFVDKRLAGKTPSKKAKQLLYDPNKEALKAFTERREKGMHLSKRVWNSLDNFRTEMETALGVGVSEGKSARELATELKKYLKDPDRLYRKVRKIKGDPNSPLVLSKKAREYEPGRGQYRSSFMNAKRLAVTEVNMSYRTSDFERWQNLPFVLGLKINLSNNHPKYDICDELTKGIYPKDFHFRGFHPFCRCYSTPVMMSDAEYSKYEDAILTGTEKDFKVKGIVTETPKTFNKYLEKNEKRIKGWAQAPYWAIDNPQYAGKVLK